MKSIQRDDSIKSLKSVKFKVEKYTQELNDERLNNELLMRNKKEMSFISKKSFNNCNLISSYLSSSLSSMSISTQYSKKILTNSSKNKRRVNVNENGNNKTQFTKKAIFTMSTSSDIKNMKTSASSYITKKQK